MRLVYFSAVLVAASGCDAFSTPSKAYAPGDFQTAVYGRTEDEMRQRFGEPQYENTEPGSSPQTGKRVFGYAFEKTKPAWHVGERGGGACVYFNAESKRADTIRLIPKPSGGPINFDHPR